MDQIFKRHPILRHNSLGVGPKERDNLFCAFCFPHVIFAFNVQASRFLCCIFKVLGFRVLFVLKVQASKLNLKVNCSFNSMYFSHVLVFFVILDHACVLIVFVALVFACLLVFLAALIKLKQKRNPIMVFIVFLWLAQWW
jgi:hypothetical protein